MEKKIYVPIADKYALTIEEAAEYTNIGQHKLRELAANPRNPFVLYVGKKVLLKRKELEKFLDKQVEL